MARLLIIGLTALAMLLASAASAHKPSDSYLSLVVDEQRVTGRWDIALRDLEHAIGLDRDGDGAVTWGEVKARHGDIAAYALARLELSSAGSACATTPVEHLIDQHSDGAYAVLRFTGDCPAALDALDIRYSFLFDLDPLHRGLGQVQSGDLTQTSVFGPERRTWHVQLGSSNLAQQIATYVREGVWHIWIGLDHILFLLMPPAAGRTAARTGRARTEPAQRTGVDRGRAGGHGLHRGPLDHAEPGGARHPRVSPSRLVESAIAASVVFAALNNIRPIVSRRLWLIAFGFGLVHGLGFASVLADLGLAAACPAAGAAGLQSRGRDRPTGAGRVVLWHGVGVASSRRDLAAVGDAAAGVRHCDHRRGLVHRAGIRRRVGRLGGFLARALAPRPA